MLPITKLIWGCQIPETGLADSGLPDPRNTEKSEKIITRIIFIRLFL